MPLTAGVGIPEEVITGWQDCVADKKRKFIILKLESADNIIIEHEDDPNDDEEGKFEDFIDKLPEKSCRYGLFKAKFTVQGGYGTSIREKNILVSWAPMAAKSKEKMVHASTKETLKDSLGASTGSSHKVGCAIDIVLSADSQAEIQRSEWIDQIGNMANTKSSGKIIAFEGEDIEE
jgi:flavodoxin